MSVRGSRPTMVRTDPYPRSEQHRFECRECFERIVTDDRVTACPDCGGRVETVSIPRE